MSEKAVGYHYLLFLQYNGGGLDGWKEDEWTRERECPRGVYLNKGLVK